MAVTLTVDALRNALRAGDTTEETTEITRLLGYASAVVDREVAGNANIPEAVQNEAAVRVAAYLYDMPSASRGTAYANVFRNCGAAAMLLPYRVHGATSTGAAVAMAQAAVGTEGNPVTALSVQGSNLVVTFADGSSTNLTLPESGGTQGVDEAAVNRLIDARVPPASVARIPNPALPAPASGTRGQFLKQADGSETYVFAPSDPQGTQDDTARAAAAAASRQARDVQHLAEDNLAHIEALEAGDVLTTAYGAFADWTQTEYNEGFQLATDLSASGFTANQFHGGTNVFSGVSTQRFIAVSVPASVDPERVRLQATVSGSTTSHPAAGQYWKQFHPNGANTQRDYYLLSSTSSDAPIAITFAAGDKLLMQVRPIEPVVSNDRLAAPGQLDRLAAAVQDVIVGDVVEHNWQNVDSDGSEGGVSGVATGTLDLAKAATYAAPAGNVDGVTAIRIPAGADSRHYRAVFGSISVVQVSGLPRLGSDTTWQYYVEHISFTGKVTLQVSDRTLAHTTWAGALADGIVTQASLADGVGGGGGGGGNPYAVARLVSTITKGRANNGIYVSIPTDAEAKAIGQKILDNDYAVIGIGTHESNRPPSSGQTIMAIFHLLGNTKGIGVKHKNNTLYWQGVLIGVPGLYGDAYPASAVISLAVDGEGNCSSFSFECTNISSNVWTSRARSVWGWSAT